MAMNKKELIADMKRNAGASFVPQSWLCKYLNVKDPKSIRPCLVGLPRINGRYFIDDVADRILREMTYKE